ncbi:MAG: stage 0 sporulation family protein [Bacilli bacterium]|nr:stage 0 sporulation family protein [Bacilli bacterium]MDD3304654.1 stage 0 sporulation family protein [Bacilli bacterium]MDD4053294.1 stage 0 sporulation family protein [Bacilli bacterium]MDD4411365.1 stage 0 sporulation family protein [Bacilli bacterium]
MIDVVGVAFEEKGRIYYFSPAGLNLNKGQNIIVETERGLQFGTIVLENTKLKKENLNLPLKRVVRTTTNEDININVKNLKDNVRAFEECRKLIIKHKLAMNLIDASFTFDRKQLLFHFTADARIDFRELAKDLASIYRTRIELRQIGIRDKARAVGGIGPCGRMLCCNSFLYNFDTVSISMAKNQNIALNPIKINGSCGRLLCCLTYENDTYLEAKKDMPEVGQIVNIKEGKGKVLSIDPLARSYRVDINDVGVVVVELK